MKKLSMLLSVIVALAMLVMPMGAMAEPTTAQVIQFANPTIYIDGEEVASLEGLAAQFAYCEGGDVVQLIFDVFAGGENANSAMLQIDPEYNVVGFIGGMSNAYTFNAMEVIGMFTEAMASDSGIDFEQLSNIIAMAETWTLPDDLTNVVAAHEADFTVTELGYQTGSTGIEMYCTQITGDAMPMLIDAARVIDNDQLISAVLQFIDPTMTTLGLADSLTSANLGMNIDATIGYDMSGEIMEITAKVTMTEEGETVSVIDFIIYMDTTDENNIICNYEVSMTDESGVILTYMDMDMTLTLTGLNAKVVEIIDGETMNMDIVVDINGMNDVVSLNASMGAETIAIVYNGSATQTGYAFALNADATDEYGSIGFEIAGDYGMTDTSAMLNLSLSANEYGEENKITLALAADMAAGVYSAELTAVSPETEPASISLKLSDADVAEGAYYTGLLQLAFNDGYSSVAIDTYVHLFNVDVDTDSFYISPAAAISLLTMDDAQFTAAQTEFDTVISNLGNIIMNTYPEFFCVQE